MAVTGSVTVVIPCFNGERFIAQAIQSVLGQTSPVLEILVIDDGSQDRSADIVRSLQSPRVRLIQQNNQGESVARNCGIDEARGDWIAFLDADDLWHPTKIQRQLAELDRASSDVICVHTGYYNFGDWSTEPAEPALRRSHKIGILDLIRFPVMPSSALVRARASVRFPEWTQMGEDAMYFAELSLHGSFLYISERLAGYRRSSAQQTRSIEHLTTGHAGWLRWLEIHRAEVGSELAAKIDQCLTSALLERLEIHKWRREWTHYWPLRRYLTSLKRPLVSPLLNERVYPPVLYRMKDWVDARLRVS